MSFIPAEEMRRCLSDQGLRHELVALPRVSVECLDRRQRPTLFLLRITFRRCGGPRLARGLPSPAGTRCGDITCFPSAAASPYPWKLASWPRRAAKCIMYRALAVKVCVGTWQDDVGRDI